MKTYKNKTILITGASSGFGLAMARQLADPTVTLLLAARSEGRMEELAEELRAQGAKVGVFAADLARPDAAAELYWRTVEAGYTIDVLINNAGFAKHGPFEEYDASTFEDLIGVNVTNLVVLTRLCVPAMLRRGDAGILNVSSVAAFQAVPFMAVYGASKAFVLSFSEALHLEYASRGITVSCICPGVVATGFQAAAGMELMQPTFGHTAETVAKDALRTLLRSEASHVSGVMNRLGAVGAKLAPRRLSAFVAGRIYRPR
jgi:uncharacterized protein